MQLVMFSPGEGENKIILGVCSLTSPRNLNFLQTAEGNQPNVEVVEVTAGMSLGNGVVWYSHDAIDNIGELSIDDPLRETSTRCISPLVGLAGGGVDAPVIRAEVAARIAAEFTTDEESSVTK